MRNLKFSNLTIKDKSTIFKWRNSKNVSQFMIKKKITSDEHNEWFNKRLKKKSSFAWVINFNQEKIGLIQIENLTKKNCNAGFYIAKKKYSYLTFLIINMLHYKVFCEHKFRVIKSYINLKNKKIRKLNKMCGYDENNKLNEEFVFTRLVYLKWLKSLGYKYLKGNYGNI